MIMQQNVEEEAKMRKSMMSSMIESSKIGTDSKIKRQLFEQQNCVAET